MSFDSLLYREHVEKIRFYTLTKAASIPKCIYSHKLPNKEVLKVKWFLLQQDIFVNEAPFSEKKSILIAC